MKQEKTKSYINLQQVGYTDQAQHANFHVELFWLTEA